MKLFVRNLVAAVLCVSSVHSTVVGDSEPSEDPCEDLEIPEVVVEAVKEIAIDLGFESVDEYDYEFCELYGTVINEADDLLDLVAASGIDIESLGLTKIDVLDSCDVEFMTLVTQLEDLLENPALNESWPLLQQNVAYIDVSYDDLLAVSLNATASLQTFLQVTGHADTTFGEVCPSVCEAGCQEEGEGTTASSCPCGDVCDTAEGNSGLCGTNGECAVFIVALDCSSVRQLDARCDTPVISMDDIESDLVDSILTSPIFQSPDTSNFCASYNAAITGIGTYAQEDVSSAKDCSASFSTTMNVIRDTIINSDNSTFAIIQVLAGFSGTRAEASAEVTTATAHLEAIANASMYGPDPTLGEVCPFVCETISCTTTAAAATSTVRHTTTTSTTKPEPELTPDVTTLGSTTQDPKDNGVVKQPTTLGEIDAGIGLGAGSVEVSTFLLGAAVVASAMTAMR